VRAMIGRDVARGVHVGQRRMSAPQTPRLRLRQWMRRLRKPIFNRRIEGLAALIWC